MKKISISSLFFKTILICFLLVFMGISASALTRYSVATGNWASTATWSAISGGASGASAPIAGDVVFIEGSRTVTIAANAACATLNIASGSTLTVGAFTLTVSGVTTLSGTMTINSATGTKTFGDLTINGTFNNTAANVPFTVNGNFQNNGVYNGGTARVTFTGAASNTVTGTSTTAFGGGITINKGVANTNVLDVQSVITMSAGGLTLTNGTFKLSSASTITPFTSNITGSPYLIPSTAGLWCNGGTMSASAMGWTINGLVHVSAGTLNAGAGLADFFAPNSASSIIVDGGNFILADRLSLGGSAWSFAMSSGSVTVAKYGCNVADRPTFNMDNAASSFSMSGGTIIISNPGGTAGQNLGYNNLATSGSGFTGGTLQIGDGSTAAASIMQIVTTNPIYNLSINSSNATAQISTSALTVTNDVTITAGVLNANNLGLTVGGSWTNNAATSAFTGGTATVTFNSSSAELIDGSFATTFTNLTLAGSNTATLDVNTSVTSNLSISSGTFDLASFTANRATAGGTLTVSNGATLKIGGTNTFPSNYTTHSIGATSTIEYSGTTQSLAVLNSAQNYGHLIISGSGTKTLSGTENVTGNLTISAGTFDLGANTINRNIAGGTLTISAGAALKIGGTNTLPSNYSTHSIGATSTIEYSGSNQSLAVLNSSQDYSNLTISGSGTKTLAGSENVTGILTFSGATITTGANNLYITSTGSVSRTSGHVIGNFRKYFATGPTSKTFEIGDASNYTPLAFAFASVTTAGDLTASTASGDHANIGTSTIDPTKSVNRNWTLSNSGIVFTTYDGTFTFVAGDLDGGTTTSNFIAGSYNAGWTYPTVGTKTSTTTQATGLTTFGGFQIGEMGVNTKTFTGTGNFSTAARWTGGTLPVAGDNLIIDGTCTVDNSGTTDNVAYGTLVIGSTAARTLNWVASGTNRLNVTNVSSSFAASALSMTNGGTLIIRGTWTSTNLTFTPGTGTIDIRSTLTLPAAYATYYNLIVNGSSTTVTAGVNATVNNDLTVTSGTFTVGAFSLAVTGITTVTSTLTITSTTGTKTFGDLIINGTFNNTAANEPITINGDFQNNGVYNGGTARVTFTGAASNTVTGTSTTAFSGGITVNKGTANTNVIDVQSLITMSSGGLTLTNGTFKLSSASTITPFTANITGSPYLIPSTAGLWCNGGTMSASAMGWTINGLIRVSAGTLNAGAGLADFFAPNSASSIIVDGGNFILADRLSLGGSAWSFAMTSGSVTVAKFGCNVADRPTFNMDNTASSFSMSGGTIIISNKGGTAGQNLGYNNLATSGTGFTGGTLQIGDGSTAAASIMQIVTTNPIYNLSINSANATAQISTSALTVTNDVTITAGVLNANNLGLTVGGDWTNNSSTSAFTGGTATVTFNNMAGTSIGGSFATTFNSLTMNRTTGPTLGANITVGGTLTFTSGNITTGSNSLYLNSTGTVSHSSGHVIGNFKKYVATGATSKTFEIGDATNYTPVTVAFASVTTAGDLTASTASGDHANIGSSTINAAKSVNRSWIMTNSGIVFTNYGATFTFVAGDLDGSAATANFIVGRYSAGWTYPTVGSKTSITTQAIGMAAFGAFQLGEICATPTTSAAGADQTGVATCGLTTVTLAANAPSVGTGAWSIISGAGGTVTTPTSATSTFSGTAGTSYTLRWTISDCTASTDDVVITFNRNPTTSAAGADQTSAATCGLTTVTLAANAPAIGTGAWSIVSGTGGSFGNATSATSTFLGTAGTAYVIRWTISNSPCTASTDDVNITFNRNPTTSAAGADQTSAATCGLTSVTLAANAASIGTGAWSIVSGAGGSFGNAASATSTFLGTAGTAYVIRWAISNAPCTASTDDVNITFNQTPTTSAAGADQTGAATCGLTSVTLAANAASIGTGAWSIVSGTGGSFGNAASATSTFSGTAGTTYTLRWTISNSPCTASTDDVVITFNQAPTTSAAGTDQTSAATCGLTSVTLAANAASIGTGAWSIVSGAGGSFGNAASATSTFLGTAGTTYTLRWTISNSPCTASTDDVVITFNQAPTTSAAGADQTGAPTCGLTTVTLAANAASIGTGAWSIISGAGGTVTTPTSATSTFTGTAGTTYTLRWTISNSPCTASTDDVVITFNQISSATISYAGTPFCTSVSVAQIVTQTGTAGGTYSSTAGLTINASTGAITPSTSTAGTYTVTYTMSTGVCTPQTATTSVTITTLPAATISYSGSPFCKSLGTGQAVTLTGTTGGTYSSTAGLTIDAGTGAIIPGTSVAGNYTVTYTMAAAGGCSVQTATTSVTITAIPAATISYAGSPYMINAGTASVTFSGTTGGTYSSTAGLSINATTGDVTLSSSTPATYTVTYTIAAAGGCSVYTTTASITVVIATKTFTGTGNFSDAARWTGSTLPTTGENLVIDGACTVDNNAGTDSIAYGTLTIGTATGRTLNWATSGTNRLNISNFSTGGGVSTLNMTNGGTLIIRGTINASTLVFTPGTGTIEIQSTITLPPFPTLNNLTINGSGITVKLGGAIVLTGNLTITTGTFDANNFNTSIAGNWINNVSTTAFTGGTATVNFNGSSAQSIGGTSATTFYNLTIANTASTVSLNINTSISNNLSVSSGTFDIAGYTANRASAGGTLTVSNNATLKIGATNSFPTNYSTNTLVVASTVEYSGTNQTVANLTYGNLKLSSSSGAAVKTFPGTALAIAGNLSSIVGSGTSVSYTAASNITVAGNVSIGSSTTFNAGSYSHSIAGNWVNSGTFNGNTGTVTFTGSGAAISGSGNQNFNNLTVSASGISFSADSIKLTGNLATTGSGSFTQASGKTLLMSGTGKTISGSGISIDNLTVSGTVTTSISLEITGNLSVSGSFIASTTTITLSGASKTMSGAGTSSFGQLQITGSITTATNFTITSGLTVSGSLSSSAGMATFTGTSTLSGTANLFNVTINGTSLQLTANSTLGIAGALTITAGTLDVTSSTPNTVNFNSGGAQNINAITYSNLVLSNGNTKTAAGAITINKDITIGTGTGFNASTYTHSVYGNWVNNGTFVAGTSTVQFLGPATAYLSGVTTFNILTSNTSSNTTQLVLQSNVSADIVNMTNGKILTGSDTLTITNTRTGNGKILGHIQRNHSFTTGVSYAFESPDNTITFSSVSSVNSITVSVIAGSISDFPFGSSMSEVYNVSVASGTYNATLRLDYEDDELNGNIESSMNIWHYNGSSWVSVGKTANDTTANYIELSGLTDITNRWTCSDASNVVKWNGTVSTNWNTAGNWTVIQGAPTMPPSASDVVDLGTASFTYQPTISTAATAKNIIFGSVQAVTLSMTTGGSLTTGTINGNWSTNRTHTITLNDQNLTVTGDMTLSNGVSGQAIDFNIGSGAVHILGVLEESGGANINFTGNAVLNIHKNFNYSSGTFTAGNGTVEYIGEGTQEMAGVTYNNLIIDKTAGLASINDTLNILGDLMVESGELENHSLTTISGNVSIDSGATLENFSVLHIGGNWANNGTFTATGASIFFDGSGTQTISATTFNNFNINKPVGSVAELTGNVVIKENFILTSGTLNIKSFTCDRITQGGNITLGDSATLIVGANNAPFNFSNASVSNSSTVIADGTGPQNVYGESFGNLVFRNAGLKTLIAPITVNGNFIIENGANFDADSSTLTLNGNWINNGTFIPSASTIICAGSSKNISGNTSFNDVTVTGSYTILNDDTFNGTLNITNTGSLSSGGAISTTINGDIINSGVVNATGTTTISCNVEQHISLINAATTVLLRLIINGSVSPVINSTAAPQFGYITVNNTGGITATTGVTVLYSLIVGPGASFNGNIYAHNILGSVTNNGTITSDGAMNFIPATAATINLGSNFSSTGIVNFGGTGALTLAGDSVSFNNVVSSNTNSAGITPVSDWAIANNFTVDSNAIFHAGNHSYFVGGDILNNGTVNSDSSTFILNGSSNQTATSMTYYNLDAANTGGGIALLDATVNNNLSATTGTLRIGNNAIPRTIAVTGNITIDSGATLNVDSSSNATHLLTVSGNIINNGTFNLRPDANSLCNITFNKNGDQTISGTGSTTNFNHITTNMGIVDTNNLDVTAANFSAPDGFLTLNNGSFNLNSSGVSVTPFNNDITTGNFLIPATAGLWVNAGTINSANMNWTVAGSVKVTGGTMNMGSAIDNVVIPKNTGNFLVTGGNLNLASRISNPGATWSLNMQGGIMTVNTQGSTIAGAAPFNMDVTGCTFNMSGGTIIIRDAGGTTGENLGYYNLSNTGTGFTGGTLQIGNTLTTASQTIGIVSTNPVYNLKVNSANASVLFQGTDLTVSNDVTITTGALNINSQTLKIGGAISNSGTFTATNGTIEMNGASAQTIPAAAFAGNLLKGLTINNNAGVTLGGALNLTDVLTVSNGSLASNGYLTLKSSATADARVAQITSASSTPITGNVNAERYVQGRRKYRLITSPVTTHANTTLTTGQEAYSIWGNWQNSGINTNPNVGNLITGGSSADGFDQGTTNASLYTYNDVTRSFTGYTTANGKNTKYTPIKAGVAYLMFVYGDRLNSVFATSPHNTVLKATGTLKTGDQVYNTSSSIPLTGVTGRFTLLGNPFASPINWATIPKTNLDNTYWGWDPNLSSTGGYITVTTTGTVTLQAPYSGTTGLNQYIQPGQGFFVRTSGSSPLLTIREQDKVSNFNGNAFRTSGPTSNISLLAINLQYINSGNKVLADGVLEAFNASFTNTASSEDAMKMANSGESIAILNGITSLSIDARQMPQNNDTLNLTVARLTKPQYTLQIFAKEMDPISIQAYLEDRYLNTLQSLSLSDTNNIVFNVSAAIPASSDINRFRIVFHSSFVVLPVTYTSIKASPKNEDIQIDWEVAEESNIKKYEIERSADGIHFNKVGEVKARGNNSSESYSWVDVNPGTGNNYFRVRAIQTDGNFFISKTVVVKINAKKSAIKVFPNPVINKQINIRADEMEKGKYSLQLHNPQGQQIILRIVDHPGGVFNQVIYLNKMLPTGMYYLKIKNEKMEYAQPIFLE